MKRIPVRSWLLISSIIFFAGCGLWSRRVQVGEQFTLRPGERVVVASADLVIELKGVGHQTSPNPQPRGFRSSYVELTVTAGGAPSRSITVDDKTEVGDYTITVKSANPWLSDGGPRCDLLVTHR